MLIKNCNLLNDKFIFQRGDIRIEGETVKEIAAELFLGEGTVRNYLSSILDKLDLRDRTQLVVYYYKNS